MYLCYRELWEKKAKNRLFSINKLKHNTLSQKLTVLLGVLLLSCNCLVALKIG